MQETQETWIASLGWEDSLEKGATTRSSILVWRIPWTGKPGGLQSMGQLRHNWASKHTHTHGFLPKRAVTRKLLDINEQILTDVSHCPSTLLGNRRTLKLGTSSLQHTAEHCVSFRDRNHQGNFWVPHSSFGRVQLRGNGFQGMGFSFLILWR